LKHPSEKEAGRRPSVLEKKEMRCLAVGG